MTGDRERGVAALRRYFFRSELPHVMTFDAFVEHYDEYFKGIADEVAGLGATIRISDLTDEDVDRAFGQVLAMNPNAYPRLQDLEGELVDPARAVRFDEVIKNTVADVEKTAVVAAAGYTAWMIGGIVVAALLPMLLKETSK